MTHASPTLSSARAIVAVPSNHVVAKLSRCPSQAQDHSYACECSPLPDSGLLSVLPQHLVQPFETSPARSLTQGLRRSRRQSRRHATSPRRDATRRARGHRKTCWRRPAGLCVREQINSQRDARCLVALSVRGRVACLRCGRLGGRPHACQPMEGMFGTACEVRRRVRIDCSHSRLRAGCATEDCAMYPRKVCGCHRRRRSPETRKRHCGFAPEVPRVFSVHRPSLGSVVCRRSPA